MSECECECKGQVKCVCSSRTPAGRLCSAPAPGLQADSGLRPRPLKARAAHEVDLVTRLKHTPEDPAVSQRFRRRTGWDWERHEQFLQPVLQHWDGVKDSGAADLCCCVWLCCSATGPVSCGDSADSVWRTSRGPRGASAPAEERSAPPLHSDRPEQSNTETHNTISRHRSRHMRNAKHSHHYL